MSIASVQNFLITLRNIFVKKFAFDKLMSAIKTFLIFQIKLLILLNKL
jgi:hypothetical protein